MQGYWGPVTQTPSKNALSGNHSNSLVWLCPHTNSAPHNGDGPDSLQPTNKTVRPPPWGDQYAIWNGKKQVCESRSRVPKICLLLRPVCRPPGFGRHSIQRNIEDTGHIILSCSTVRRCESSLVFHFFCAN